LYLLIKVAQIIFKNEDNFQFTLCGKGSEFDPLVSEIKKNNLEEFFQMPGNVDNPFHYLKNGDIFVLPSRIEDFSVALLEAGAAGLPAIAFDVGGNKEIILHGHTGFLVEPFNVQLFAERILLLISDKDGRKRMGKCAQKRIYKYFSEEKRKENLIALMKSIKS
jgi:glycosyltransferase involved in cell wall biosynthesis